LVFKASVGETHIEQLEMGCIDILGHFYCTSELATYTILLLTSGSWNHRGKWSLIYFGTMERWYVSCQQENKMGGYD
jgi:hypothetical protein